MLCIVTIYKCGFVHYGSMQVRRSPTQTFSFWGLVRNFESVCTNRPLQTVVFSFLSDYCLPERSSMQEFGFRFAGGLCFLFQRPVYKTTHL